MILFTLYIGVCANKHEWIVRQITLTLTIVLADQVTFGLSKLRTIEQSPNEWMNEWMNKKSALKPTFSGLPSLILTSTALKGHWRLFLLVSSFLYIFFSGYVCWIKLWILSFQVHVQQTLLFYCIVSYRIVSISNRLSLSLHTAMMCVYIARSSIF